MNDVQMNTFQIIKLMVLIKIAIHKNLFFQNAQTHLKDFKIQSVLFPN